jgi:LysR family transcriptional regulator, cys regulon transcriptional activator
MNIHHLRAICEVVNQGMKISTAATRLHKSQPGISRQVREIEEELGVKIFQRKRNKIELLTPPGREILRVAERVLKDIDSLRLIGQEYSKQDVGDLTIATTHTQARYSLPGVVQQFMARFPNVRLTLRQGDPVQCCELVASGAADIAISTEIPAIPRELVCLPAYRLTRCIVARRGHRILRTRKLTLEALAKYPVITFDTAFSGRLVVNQAFASADIVPRVLLSAVDADVSKAYVERGMGIAILASVAFDPVKDTQLALRDASHLFKSSFLNVSIRRNAYLRGYMTAFMSAFAPHFTPAFLEKAVAGGDVDIAHLRRAARPLTHPPKNQ